MIMSSLNTEKSREERESACSRAMLVHWTKCFTLPNAVLPELSLPKMSPPFNLVSMVAFNLDLKAYHADVVDGTCILFHLKNFFIYEI